MKIPNSLYSTEFEGVLYSHDRYLITYGSRGSGKTDTLYLKYLCELFSPYYFKLAYVNKEKANIRDQQYAGFKRVAKRIGIFDLLKFYDGDYRIINPANGNALIPKGMDDPEKTKGLDDVTAVWWDEINKGTIEDFRALNALLRSPKSHYLQFAASFNPVHDKHWLRELFFDPEDRHKIHPDFKKQGIVHRSTYLDNEFIDQQAYLQTLMLSASGNLNRIRVDIEGDWGLPENKTPWLYNFNEERHVSDKVEFRPMFPVYLSFDFNRNPVTCTAWQMTPSLDSPLAFVHCIAEFGGQFQLQELCERLLAAYPTSILYITGDSSGNKGDVAYNSQHDTAYNMIEKYLNVSKAQMNPNKSNLLHENSRYLCNALFFHLTDLKISSKCVNLIEDCRVAQVDEKATNANQLKKDRDLFKMDYFDGMRYLMQAYMYEFAKIKYLR